MNRDYDRIESAIRFLAEHAGEQPELSEVAAHMGLSPFHCQRLFQRWAGVSPKRFLQALTVDYAKRLLDESRSVLDTALALGLSGPSRLHDHFVALEAVTPGEYKRGGAGVTIRYGFVQSPFGDALIGTSDRGLVHLSFAGEAGPAAQLGELRAQWPGASLQPDAARVNRLGRQIFASGAPREEALRLYVGGSTFQIAVWRALLALPAGTLCAYGDLANALGKPRAARAVGSAVGANRIAWLIPCHRVIRSLGGIGDYRWGADRKRSMIAWEALRGPGPQPMQSLDSIRHA